MMIRIFALISILILSEKTSAQDNTAVFQTETIKSLRSNEEHPYVCTFRVTDDKLEWIQGSVVYSFIIISTEGSLSSDGKVIYHIIKEDKAGKVKAEREADSKVVLTLDLSNGGDVGAFYRFRIANI